MNPLRLMLLVYIACGAVSQALADAPHYEECRLDSLFPAGGRAGETVSVEFFGNNGGLADARNIIVDGPPGITVEQVENVSPIVVRAKIKIAADALPGRRMLRVLSQRSGLTNMLYFVVGRLPERSEKEPNHSDSTAEVVDLPMIVNGRIDPAADVDCFRFAAKQGQRIVAAVFAHALDSHGQGQNFGLADANLTIADASGRILAEAQDTLGLDPLVEFVPQADGQFVARVQLVAFKGFPQAVYRLAIGEIPIVTSIFPPTGLRGTALDVEVTGVNVPAGTRIPGSQLGDAILQATYLAHDSPLATGFDLPLLVGDVSPKVESEPNQTSATATSLTLGVPTYGRFQEMGDVDWYRVSMTAGQRLCVETTAHRYLRSAVDTSVEVFDPAGKMVAANDDGFAIDYMSIHDFLSPDSRVVFSAAADGDFLVKVSDQAGNAGTRAVYRLCAIAAEPDFELFQFPDGVPVWGPGSTAALIVKVERGAVGFGEDIELSVEGLPAGWTGSKTISPGQPPRTGHWGKHHFLTITAPTDAAIGTVVPFRVVGRAKVGARMIEHTAQPMTLYYTSDTGFFRITPTARAAVAKPQGPWLSAAQTELTATVGGTVEIPVNVHGAGSETTVALVANAGMYNVGCGLNAPRTVPIQNGTAVLPVTLPADLMPAGDYFLVVAQSWRSDIRIGMPGPCTPPIRLHVMAKAP